MFHAARKRIEKSRSDSSPLKEMTSLLLATICACGSLTPSLNGQVSKADEAFRSGGFAAAAKVTGSYVGSSSGTHGWAQWKLRDLTAASDVIVLAKLDKLSSDLTENGRRISTTFAIHPEASLKSTLDPGARLSYPGGRLTFADGTRAQDTADNESELEDTTARFILFLRKVGRDYKVVGASQGVILINEDNRTTRSFGVSSDPIHEDLSGVS